MEYSQKAIQKLGKRIRDGIREAEDIYMLEKYRESYDSLLFQYYFAINEALSGSGVAYLVSGRPKRTKSIIRKLQRTENYRMDLSRLADVVGLRIIVEDIEAQNRCIEILAEALSLINTNDYRDRDDGYRAVHLIVLENRKRIEVQIRTLMQHLWAEESESFGERAKEGGGTQSIREYLSLLSEAGSRLEGSQNLEDLLAKGEIMRTRSPIDVKLPRLQRLFGRATVNPSHEEVYSSYLVVFDTMTNELTNCYHFDSEERGLALSEFRRLSRQLEENRYDVVVLNSTQETTLAVTHSRFFRSTHN